MQDDNHDTITNKVDIFYVSFRLGYDNTYLTTKAGYKTSSFLNYGYCSLPSKSSKDQEGYKVGLTVPGWKIPKDLGVEPGEWGVQRGEEP